MRHDRAVGESGRQNSRAALPVPPGIRELARSLGRTDPERKGIEAARLQEIMRILRATARRTDHPCFLGYITGSADPVSITAAMLAADLNQNVGGWDVAAAATYMEMRLVRWFGKKLGLPATRGGLMVPGGALGNLTALKVARDARDISRRQRGVRDAPPIKVFASVTRHATIDRACDILGLGERAVEQVETNADGTMNVRALDAAIRAARRRGEETLAVVATAGTTSTGVVDPLGAIAEICRRHSIWLHVDAAYGGAVVLSQRLRRVLSGIGRADSVTIDAHKWLYTPLLASMLLFRDATLPVRAFAKSADYAAANGEIDFSDLGPQWSRAFDALKVWLVLAANGTEELATRIERNVELAHYFAKRISGIRHFELLAKPMLSVCCFRYLPDHGDADAVNTRLQRALANDPRLFCTGTTIDGRAALRICIVNAYTTRNDIDKVIRIIGELGRGADS